MDLVSLLAFAGILVAGGGTPGPNVGAGGTRHQPRPQGRLSIHVRSVAW